MCNMAAFRCMPYGIIRKSGKSLFLKNANRIGRRTYLSSLYACDNVWQKRLEEPVIKNVNMATYYIELDQKFQSSKRISAIDLDLYAHKITDFEQLEELEDLLRRFRRSPDTIHMLPSTSHAVIKSFLQFGQYDMLLNILRDRHNYGIFPDYYCLNLMMDTFLVQQNNRDATKVATLMMLQEDFDHPISKHLALYSCLSYLRNPRPDAWLPDPPPPPPEETDDIVIIRLNYLRPNYFDDHFDIKEPEKLLGKTLVMLGSHFDNQVGRTCKIVGYGLYGKWDKLKNCITDYLHEYQSEFVYKEGIEILNKILEKIPDDDSGTRQSVISEIQPLIEQLAVKTIDRDILKDVENSILEAVTKHEPSDIDHQLKLNNEWVAARVKLVEDQMQSYIRRMRIKKLEEMKEDLKKREQLLFFFENYETNIKKAELYDKVAAEEAEKAKKKDLDKEYIPPEVHQPVPARKY